MSDLKLQNYRENPNKPAVVKGVAVWWAQVVDLHGKLRMEVGYTQPEALKKAHELAALVESQRMEPTA